MSQTSKHPTLLTEHELFASGFPIVIGVDEVGRGAIAGPVAVGVHVTPAGTNAFPEGLRDSKLLSEKRREAMAVLVEQWGVGSVGFGSASEIDEHGITVMLGVACRRALCALEEAGIDVVSGVVLLDGSHDWLTPALETTLQVRTLVGADQSCASVAAASVRAKVARDNVMRRADVDAPQYLWRSNKGYGSRAHYDRIAAHGLTNMHRRSWIRL